MKAKNSGDSSALRSKPRVQPHEQIITIKSAGNSNACKFFPISILFIDEKIKKGYGVIFLRL